MEPGKPVFGGPSETLSMPVLVGKVIGSVAMDSTKRLALGPSRKALDQYRSDGSLLHQLRDEVSEELGALLFEETAHFYCVGSFFKLVLGTMWHTNIIGGVDLDEEFNNLWPETYGLEKIHPNLNRGFWDDTSRLFGVVMAKASSKGHYEGGQNTTGSPKSLHTNRARISNTDMGTSLSRRRLSPKRIHCFPTQLTRTEVKH